VERADGKRLPLHNLRDRRLVAVAGIARPQAFFAMLRASGLELEDD
jgi:tetraacyldisaccharide 4'-kinase